MALEKRLVIFGRAGREVSSLEELMRPRGFQVFSVDAPDDLLDVITYSRPDALLFVGDPDRALLARAVSANQSAGKSLIVTLWHGATAVSTIDLLNAGVDYVCQAYHPDVLAAQMRAFLRRVSRDRSPLTVIELGYLRIDLQGQEVTVDGREVALTPTEFAVLRSLAERPGTVLPSGEIMQQAMGVRIADSEAQDLLKVHIHRLRQKLEQHPENPRFIKTIRGRGYMYAFERRAMDRQAPGPVPA